MNWISVKERLPRNGHLILVCTNNNIYHITCRGSDFWNKLINGNEESFGATFITHWMELPEPPQNKNTGE